MKDEKYIIAQIVKVPANHKLFFMEKIYQKDFMKK